MERYYRQFRTLHREQTKFSKWKLISKNRKPNQTILLKKICFYTKVGEMWATSRFPHFSMSLSPLCPCTFSSIGGNCLDTTVHRCQSCIRRRSCRKHYWEAAGLTADCPSCFDSASSFPPGSGDRRRTCVYLKYNDSSNHCLDLPQAVVMTWF